MLTDFDVAQLIAAQYAGTREPFDLFVDPAHNDFNGVAWAAAQLVTEQGTVWVICFEGSHDPPDWAHDFDPRRVWIDVLGDLHAGFYANMQETYALIVDRCKGPAIFAGHSLGAAHADIATGLAARAGLTPLFYLRWGEPAPAWGSRLGSMIASVPGRTYRNIKPHGWATDQDLVTPVPLAIAGWRHPQAFSDVWAPTDPSLPWYERWGILSLHHFHLYLGATPATVIL